MKVLVTGAAGFIGSYLVTELVNKGFKVIAADIASQPDWVDLFKDSISYVRTDMGNEAAIYKLMGLSRPSHIIHLASLLAGPCDADPGLGFKINFQSTLTLLDACVAFGVKRFIMTSSIAVFGRGLPEPVADDEMKLPANVYGHTKLLCEHMMEWYHKTHRLSIGAVRFPWVFGPGRTTGITAEYSSKLLDSIAAGESLQINNPEEKGDWLYVKDAVKSLMLLLRKKDHSLITYNIMGEYCTIKEAMEIAIKFCPDADIKYIEGNNSLSPYPTSYDDSRARKDLGWKPDYSLEQGIQEHITTMISKNTTR